MMSVIGGALVGAAVSASLMAFSQIRSSALEAELHDKIQLHNEMELKLTLVNATMDNFIAGKVKLVCSPPGAAHGCRQRPPR